PDRYIPDFIKAGADMVSVHIENTPHIHRTIELIKSLGAKAGVVINPGTPLSALEEAIYYVDFVLLMSVNPGFGGQKFIQRSIERLRRLKALLQEKNPSVLIEIDGGIKEDNIIEVAKAGADILVVGSGIFHSEDIKAQTKKLKEMLTFSEAL
ncbi:ribulose-phosphate 3-epimerase, partial [Acinetobacter baumannii]